MPGTDMERSPGYILKQKYGAEQYIQYANFCTEFICVFAYICKKTQLEV